MCRPPAPQGVMADIGSTLRETRIRKKIDITTVEEATKIRAKYLRAIENEEWGVLPGPDLRQDLPAHVRAVPRPRRASARRRVQRAGSRSRRTSSCPRSRARPRIRTRVRRVGPPSRLAALALGVARVPRLPAGARPDRRRRQRRPGPTANRLAPRQAAARRSASRRAAPAAAAARARQGAARGRSRPRPVWVCLVDARDRPARRGGPLAAGTARARSRRRPSR